MTPTPLVGSKAFLDERGIKAWAGVPMEVILRAMAPDKDPEERVRHAMILWSWCGPFATEAVVRKDARGSVLRDGAGREIPAKLRDLAELLGMDKSAVTRIVQALEKQGLVRWSEKVVSTATFRGRSLCLVFRPAAYDAAQKVVSTATFTIAGVVVSTDNLPADPVARAEAIRFLEVVSTGWKQELGVVKTRYRELLKQGLSAHGILMEKRRKSSRVESAPFPAPEPISIKKESSSSVSSETPTTTTGTANVKVTTPRTDAATILGAMREYNLGDLKAADNLMKDVRAIAPEATAADVCRLVHEKARVVIQKRKGTGYLLECVRNAFSGEWRIEATPIDAPTDEEIARMLAETDRALAADE